MEDTIKFKDYLKEELKDPEFREAFDEEEVYASLAIQIAKIRQKKKLTQKELAKRLHTTQQTISRLENIRNKSYSLQTLIKLARILDKQVSVKFSSVLFLVEVNFIVNYLRILDVVRMYTIRLLPILYGK
jgi:transcriptional regulator with XRE-family HTH domain